MIRVAIIDSGVNDAHPHVAGVVDGVAIGADLELHDDYLDRLGHGTAVAAAIHEKAPAAELHIVKVFDRQLTASIGQLVSAIDWAAGRVQLVNLSLGTSTAEHASPLRAAVARAAAAGTVIVAAGEDGGVWWLPGMLDGVVKVQLSWSCPREEIRLVTGSNGDMGFEGSGYARPIPGVPPDDNLKGLSFAVANVCGVLARVLDPTSGGVTYETAVEALRKVSAGETLEARR